MGADKKLILSLRPAHGCFIANLVGLLRCHFAGRERLPDLKEQGSTLHSPVCFRLVLALYQQKLNGSRDRIAEIGGQGSQLFGVEPIVKAFLHCLDSAFPSRHLIGPDISCSREHTSFTQKNGQRHISFVTRYIPESLLDITFYIINFLINRCYNPVF